MKKVLVIDDVISYLVREAKEKIDTYIASNMDDTLLKGVSTQGHEINEYDITSEFIKAGGDKNYQFLVLNEPRLCFHNNYLDAIINLDNDKQGKRIDILTQNFDFERILEYIKETKPDIILLDINIVTWMPEHYKQVYQDKYTLFSNTINDTSKDAQSKIQQLYSVYNNGDENHKFLKPSIPRSFSDIVLENRNGGIILAHMLKENNISFSFWSADFGHCNTGIFSAYYLGLISHEEMEGIAESFLSRMNNHSSNKLSGIVVYSNGTLFTHGKEYLKKDENDNLIFAADKVFGINKILQIASSYQSTNR